MSRFLLVVIACVALVQAKPQITLEATATTTLRTLLSLKAGPKLIQSGIMLDTTAMATITIYNFDLTAYRHLLVPPPPAGYTWTGAYGNVTEALFDTDSTTLEYMMTASGPNPGAFHFAVIREDGAVLFSKTPGMSLSALGDQDYNSSPSVVQTSTGAKLLLQNTIGAPTEVYALPGSVPCLPVCDGSLITGVGEQVAPPAGPELFVYPNPANEGAEVLYQLPQGSGSAELIFYNTAGQQVLQLPVQPNSERTHISTAQLPAGTYLYQLRTGTEVIGGPRLVVVH